MATDVYTAPDSELPGAEIKHDFSHYELASRWMRFWGSLLDGIFLIIAFMPIIYFTVGFEEAGGFEYELIVTVIGFIVYLVLNGYLLYHSGQTLGKKIVNTRVIMTNGSHPKFFVFIIRYLVGSIPTLIPVIGIYYAYVEVLTIFGQEKRCIHDYAAGTKVISVK